MIEKPKRPKQPSIQERQPPRTLQELINRYDLDNTKIYDFLDELVRQVNKEQDDLQNQINDKNIITIGLNSDTSVTSSVAYRVIDLALTKEISKIGTKLTLQDGKVLIGSGVSKVLISGKLQTQGDNQLYGLSLSVNSVQVSQNYCNPPSAGYSQVSATPVPVSVSEGDVVKMGVYINNANSTKNIKAYNGATTYLTVEVIK